MSSGGQFWMSLDSLLIQAKPRTSQACCWWSNRVRPRSALRRQRRQTGRLDAQRLAQVTQQRRRHGADAVQRPPAHHEADVQCQTQLVVVAPRRSISSRSARLKVSKACSSNALR